MPQLYPRPIVREVAEVLASVRSRVSTSPAALAIVDAVTRELIDAWHDLPGFDADAFARTARYRQD